MEGEVKGKTFKMKGHTLPGINQRSDANATNVAEQGLAGSSAFQQGLVDNTRSAFGGGGGAMGGAGNVQPNPLPPTPIVSKPSIAKDKAYKNMHLPENKHHNAKAATEQHFGDPHGPKPSMAKIYDKPKGKRTKY